MWFYHFSPFSSFLLKQISSLLSGHRFILSFVKFVVRRVFLSLWNVCMSYFPTFFLLLLVSCANPPCQKALVAAVIVLASSSGRFCFQFHSQRTLLLLLSVVICHHDMRTIFLFLNVILPSRRTHHFLFKCLLPS